ncbi:hypothetical protein F5984_18645 [Rudanella paleaurantiibacter]|uniref:Uncharacterized protein n=1 Tax=Rudanella paleaurantiibacter TaxID=2614655 RepID=A0A7J5TVY3_9BACT|nr:hypothetical protein [Rudanella paleaurantiibacter]KAB7728392.1 hypothetical protein F5984_18645 [Rudanella paleaurantiibacter]
MKKIYILLSLLILSTVLPGCKKDPPAVRNSLNIVLSDSLNVEYDDDNVSRIPESIRELCAVISADEKQCTKTYILDPTLVRPDQTSTFSMKTTIEKGGTKKTGSPTVIGKLISKNFDELEVPKVFANPARSGTADSLTRWLIKNAKNDSILVYSNSFNEYRLGKKSYRVFSNVDDIRTYIQKVLCANDRANFTVLYNPPAPIPHNPPPPPDPPTPVQPEPPGATGGNNNTGSKKEVGSRIITKVKTEIPYGICNYETHTLHEKVLDENGNVQFGKVLVVNCKACGYGR